MTDYNAITTLNEIRKNSPCKDGWEKLLKHLGKTAADDEPLHLSVIIDSNGLGDAIWCLRAKSLERLSRHFQAWCAEQVLRIYEATYQGDVRVRDQIAMLRNDDATVPERYAAARAAAWAALESRGALRGAAWAAAETTAREAALEAARAEVAREAQEAQLRLMIGETK